MIARKLGRNDKDTSIFPMKWVTEIDVDGTAAAIRHERSKNPKPPPPPKKPVERVREPDPEPPKPKPPATAPVKAKRKRAVDKMTEYPPAVVEMVQPPPPSPPPKVKAKRQRVVAEPPPPPPPPPKPQKVKAKRQRTTAKGTRAKRTQSAEERADRIKGVLERVGYVTANGQPSQGPTMKQLKEWMSMQGVARVPGPCPKTLLYLQRRQAKSQCLNTKATRGLKSAQKVRDYANRSGHKYEAGVTTMKGVRAHIKTHTGGRVPPKCPSGGKALKTRRAAGQCLSKSL
eukprot:jgi/Mesvir1/18584/Mv17093-RA.1